MLDEAAFDRALAQDPDAALVLLVEMATATDERLRAAARALAAKVVLDRARTGTPRSSGTRALRTRRADLGGDLDLDASLDALSGARAERRPVGLDELVARDWGRPETALCVVIDSSGSMSGERLAAAALTAAACSWRAPGDHAVLSFARDVTVLREMGSTRPPSTVVDAVLALRGHGVTALATALSAAADQLSRTRAARRVVVLLSDCRETDEQDPVPVASALPELLVLAPAGDSDQAEELARRSGARWARLSGAADAPRVLAELLG
ncbi:MAG: hypothetical protein JWN08_3576 [Frankiales bacterium]|nr:hypothetical protein [Frankiales bacterium]